MTAFQAPLIVGVDTGVPTENTQASVETVKVITVSAGNKRRTVGVEYNSLITGIQYVASGVSSNADKGVSLFVGTSASQARFGSSTNLRGTTTGSLTLTQSILDTGQNAIVVESTCSGASASDFVEGKLHCIIRSAKRI